MRDVSVLSRRENQDKHFTVNNIFFFFSFENCAVYAIMWKNVVEPDRPQPTIRRMRIVCWVTKVTNTHSEYVILIVLQLQQLLSLLQMVAHQKTFKTE